MNNNLIPFCIYHYIDHKKNKFYGSITNSKEIIDNSGKKSFKCVGNEKLNYYGTFYALSSSIRPIPKDLKLINIVNENIKYTYDPFFTEKDNISFLTWTTPVDNTVELYLHMKDGIIFPSFEKNPPSKDNGWTQSKLSPIFVLIDPETSGIKYDLNLKKITPYLRDNNNLPIFNFSVIDNRCIPSNLGLSLNECFLLTDKNSTKKYHTLLEELRNKKKRVKISWILIFLISLFFILTSFILLQFYE
jgi:hypothetical protein